MEAIIEADTRQRRAQMGERLRQIRHSQGMTLADVARQSGLAISTVSKVERGVMALTYDRFSQLADGLGVDIAELFTDEGERFAPGGLSVARKGDYRLHETDNYRYEMLFPEVWRKAMTPIMGSVKPHEKTRIDRFVTHPGQEFLLVLDGRVTVHLEGMDPITLEEGDSIYFDSNRGHLYASALDRESRILVVCTELAEVDPQALPGDLKGN
ncbi:MAG: XRE family transcriptional regulator [Rhizobiaceae bacterium MnEN-MB40S]|nr:MAG: XRE family transcriptional regulator [Rhizobiaceae bacterium MnEN-MB40S]